MLESNATPAMPDYCRPVKKSWYCWKSFSSCLWTFSSLPPAYVVRREGNVLTRVCLSVHRGGQVQPGEGEVRSSCWGGGGSGPAAGGGQVQLGGVRSSCWGGVRSSCRRGGSGPAAGGGSGPAAGGGQHLAPSCGRYASCVHAGGLSCFPDNFTCM